MGTRLVSCSSLIKSLSRLSLGRRTYMYVCVLTLPSYIQRNGPISGSVIELRH